MLFLSRNKIGLEIHPKLSVTGCELPTRRLVAKIQEGHANVETPRRHVDSFGKETTTPIPRHKRINKPNITFPNLR
jgi:hypothetical protein